MGQPKLGLPLGNGTVLEHVVKALRLGGVEQVLVVLGPHVSELGTLAERAGASVLRLAEATPDMRATVEQGLRWLEERFAPTDEDAWLLCPADHPMLDPNVVREIVTIRQPGASIVVPTFAGRRGHPTRIGWKHVARIRAHPADQGLNTYLRAHQDETLGLAVSSAAILCDLDTPEDYERLKQM
jgi:CTP:molybdopterin cytidylyltransferase MocA